MRSGRAVALTAQQREAFYVAAIAGLRALDARERVPRRFGADATTRWASFKGALTEADRVDFLLRDAAVTWGAAFSPVEAFNLFGVAPDDPFGADWRSLSVSAAKRCLNEVAADPGIAGFADLLGVQGAPVDLPAFSSSTRVAVAGGSALVAVARAFCGRSDLSWSDQVLAVAETPAHRQLAGLLAIAAGASGRTRLTRPGDDIRATLSAAGFKQIDVAVVSQDAEPDCTDFARRAAGVV